MLDRMKSGVAWATGWLTSANASATPNPNLIPGWVLIVDDEKESRDTLSLILRVDGWDTQVAEDADAALDILDAAETSPTCIVLDVILPGMDGWTLAIKLRELECKTPIVFVSGIEPNRPAESRYLPSDVPCLSKPLSRKDLLNAVSPYRGQRLSAAI